LLALPLSVERGKGDSLVDLQGSLRTASTLAQNLLLEYANGMTGKDLGWGRLNESNLRRIMALHTAYAELVRRTAYVARTRGSNLLNHVLRSLEQKVAGSRAPEALGNVDDAALVLVGHDTNLSNISGILGISWLLPGYQPNDPVPGGALVFELWRAVGTKQYSVRTYYTAQSLDQMRHALSLTTVSPPLRAPIFVPGCSTSSEGFGCPWQDFRRTISTSIDPGFVVR
jgi:4-phytase/acid phosphatase